MPIVSSHIVWSTTVIHGYDRSQDRTGRSRLTPATGMRSWLMMFEATAAGTVNGILFYKIPTRPTPKTLAPADLLMLVLPTRAERPRVRRYVWHDLMMKIGMPCRLGGRTQLIKWPCIGDGLETSQAFRSPEEGTSRTTVIPLGQGCNIRQHTPPAIDPGNQS